MTLKERYNEERLKPSPGVCFLMEVAEVTKRSLGTVRMWMIDAQIPDALTQQMLADHFGTTPEELFPPTDGAVHSRNARRGGKRG